MKVWKHYLILLLKSKNAEQQISGDRLQTAKAKKEDVAFLHDRRNARKIQMPTLDHESREKYKENVKQSKRKSQNNLSLA